MNECSFVDSHIAHMELLDKCSQMIYCPSFTMVSEGRSFYRLTGYLHLNDTNNTSIIIIIVALARRRVYMFAIAVFKNNIILLAAIVFTR